MTNIDERFKNKFFSELKENKDYVLSEKYINDDFYNWEGNKIKKLDNIIYIKNGVEKYYDIKELENALLNYYNNSIEYYEEKANRRDIINFINNNCKNLVQSMQYKYFTKYGNNKIITLDGRLYNNIYEVLSILKNKLYVEFNNPYIDDKINKTSLDEEYMLNQLELNVNDKGYKDLNEIINVLKNITFTDRDFKNVVVFDIENDYIMDSINEVKSSKENIVHDMIQTVIDIDFYNYQDELPSDITESEYLENMEFEYNKKSFHELFTIYKNYADDLNDIPKEIEDVLQRLQKQCLSEESKKIDIER